MIPRQKGWSFIIRFPNIWEKPKSTFFFLGETLLSLSKLFKGFQKPVWPKTYMSVGHLWSTGIPYPESAAMGRAELGRQTGLHPTSTLATISGILQAQGWEAGVAGAHDGKFHARLPRLSDRWHSWRNVTEESPLGLNEASNIQGL